MNGPGYEAPQLQTTDQYFGDGCIDKVDALIVGVEEASLALGLAHAQEQRLADLKPLVKREAILRLMQTTNELTGKQHSASSAEAVVELDPEFMTHRQAQSDSVISRFVADGHYWAARLRAERAIHQERDNA